MRRVFQEILVRMVYPEDVSSNVLVRRSKAQLKFGWTGFSQVEKLRVHPWACPSGPSIRGTGNIRSFRVQDDRREAKTHKASVFIAFHEGVYLDRTCISVVVSKWNGCSHYPFQMAVDDIHTADKRHLVRRLSTAVEVSEQQ